MKSIKLTDTHKAKLLEMCKVLFPEYVNIQIVYENLLQFSGKNNFIIHWFEFCLTHLSEKLLNRNGAKEGHITVELSKFVNEVVLCQNVNPIDYLYSEFLKVSKK